MTICYYVTGHGFGHAVRAAQIINAFPVEVPVIVRTTVPKRFFDEELQGRDFTYAPAEFDCGCLQSDSVTVLPRATMDRYAELAQANTRRLASEVAFLRDAGVRAVVTDIASFPLRCAHEAGVPGYAVANFTWHDIYQEYVETPADKAMLAHMADEYAWATTAFLTPLSIPSVGDPFPRKASVPLVARHGTNIRQQIVERVGEGKSLALLYLGPWGVEMDWQALAEIADWLFLTFDPPAQTVSNVFPVDRRVWSFADTAASVDAVVSKAGYGTVTECIANDVPLIYVPRTGFAEYNALVSGMTCWGGGIPVSETEFRAGHWEHALNTALSSHRDRNAYGIDGASVIADALVRACAT